MTMPEQSEEPGAPQPDERPSPRPGTRMLEIPQDSADPARLAEQSIEKLKREHRRRTSKKEDGHSKVLPEG